MGKKKNCYSVSSFYSDTDKRTGATVASGINAAETIPNLCFFFRSPNFAAELQKHYKLVVKCGKATTLFSYKLYQYE